MSTPKNASTPQASPEPLTVSPPGPPALVVLDEFVIQTANGELANLRFNNYGDLILKNPSRATQGSSSKCRALTIGSAPIGAAADQLVINFENDFSSGVRIDGQVQLHDLQPVPANMETDRVVVGSDGKLYKQD